MNQDPEAAAFYEGTKNNPPSKALVEAVKLFETPGKALDLGVGAGKDTKFLLEQGFEVTAVDMDPRVKAYLDKLSTEHLTVVISDFSDFQFGHYDLVNAHNSLSFTDRDNFDQVMQRVLAAINQGGVFVGTLFGPNHQWNTPDSRMSFVTREQAEKLFAGMKIIKFEEQEQDRELTVPGNFAHWHSFYITAQK